MSDIVELLLALGLAALLVWWMFRLAEDWHR